MWAARALRQRLAGRCLAAAALQPPLSPASWARFSALAAPSEVAEEDQARLLE